MLPFKTGAFDSRYGPSTRALYHLTCKYGIDSTVLPNHVSDRCGPCSQCYVRQNCSTTKTERFPLIGGLLNGGDTQTFVLFVFDVDCIFLFEAYLMSGLAHLLSRSVVEWGIDF